VNPVLAATSISVRIGGKTLLDDVSLSLGFGEIVALVGPNGAGKSTLLRVLSGDLAPHAGTVHLNGRTLASYGPRALAGRRAVLSQSLNVAFPFTVAEIVRMKAGDGRGRRIDDLVEAALAEVDLGNFHERVITTLSGASSSARISRGCWFSSRAGKRRMVRACCCFDEPTANLDLRHQLDVMAAASARAARA
jgi:iron complex transport system ATP-binding protein